MGNFSYILGSSGRPPYCKASALGDRAMSSFLNELKEGAKRYGEEVAFLVNCLLLTLAYIVGVGLTWLVAGLVHKKFLAVYPDHSKNSYWEKSNLSNRKKEDYYRQF